MNWMNYNWNFLIYEGHIGSTKENFWHDDENEGVQRRWPCYDV
jgi:hypothetical protein